MDVYEMPCFLTPKRKENKRKKRERELTQGIRIRPLERPVPLEALSLPCAFTSALSQPLQKRVPERLAWQERKSLCPFLR